MSTDPDPLQLLAGSIWGAPLGADDAALLHRLAQQVGHTEMDVRLRTLAMRVAKGQVDAPSAAVWLARQRPRHGSDP